MGVHRPGGAHAGRRLSPAQPMGGRLPVKPSLLSGTESLSLPLDQTRGQLTSWWGKEAKLHTLIHTFNAARHILVKIEMLPDKVNTDGRFHCHKNVMKTKQKDEGTRKKTASTK